jgi:nucleoside permease NupC
MPRKKEDADSKAYARTVFIIPSTLFMALMNVSIPFMFMFNKLLEPVVEQIGTNEFHNGDHRIAYMYNFLTLGTLVGIGLSALVYAFYGILKYDDVDVFFYELNYVCSVFLIPLAVFGTIAIVIRAFIRHLDRKSETIVISTEEDAKKIPLLAAEQRI